VSRGKKGKYGRFKRAESEKKKGRKKELLVGRRRGGERIPKRGKPGRHRPPAKEKGISGLTLNKGE